MPELEIKKGVRLTQNEIFCKGQKGLYSMLEMSL
jgi:hypothetical protein